jgi:hypothetical protein
LGFHLIRMIKNILLVIFTFSAFNLKAQTLVSVTWQTADAGNANENIYYNINQKLTWPDFKGKPDATSFAAAITESGFGYQLGMSSSRGKTSINITVYCYFNKNKSWVKKGMNTDYALLHEQHHFDVTYINTLLFVQKLKAAKFTRSNCSSLSAQIHDECFKALNKMQNEYDGETSNGRKPAVQAAWNKKIDAILASLITN